VIYRKNLNDNDFNHLLTKDEARERLDETPPHLFYKNPAVTRVGDTKMSWINGFVKWPSAQNRLTADIDLPQKFVNDE
jgi:hypothetical protein